MPIFGGKQNYGSAGNSHKKHTLLLFVGALFFAALTGVAAEVLGEMQAILALVFLFCLGCAMGDYKYGILLTLLLLPLSASQLIPREILGITGLNPFNVALLLTTLSFVFTWLVNPRAVYIPLPTRYFWLYLGVVLLAVVRGVSNVPSIPAYYAALQIIDFDSAGGYVREVLFKPMLILAVAFLLAVGVRNAPRPNFFLLGMFAASCMMPLAVIADVISGRGQLSSMVGGAGMFSGMHANELGLMFNMSFALALFCFFSRTKPLPKLLLGLVVGLLLLGIVLTFSRGAYLGCVAVILYFLFRQRKFGIMALGLLLLPIVVLLIPDAVLQRASTGLSDMDIDTISAGRVNDIWRPLLPDIGSSLLIGEGLSSVLWSDAAKTNNFFMTNSIGHPHSAYLGLLLDFGILGGIAVLVFFWHCGRLFSYLGKTHPDPLWRDFFQGATACLLLLLLQGVTDDRFTPTIPQSFLWLSYGMAVGFLPRVARAQSIHNHHGSGAA